MTSPDPPPRADPPATWTILDVLKWTTARFAERGLASPRLDAELLAGHAFGLARVGLYTQFDRPLAAEELARFRDLVKRRQAGEPVAYLTGRKHFWNLELTVDHHVLVPRPDTEAAVEAALDLCRPAPDQPEADGAGSPGAADAGEHAAAGENADQARDLAHADASAEAPDGGGQGAGEGNGPAVQGAGGRPGWRRRARALTPLRVADIGTGSGAIALVLKKELPHAEVLAVDSSPEALDVARGNADRLGLAVTFLQGDLLAPLAGGEPLDLIVANLPYIPSGDIPALAPEVRSEPLLALDGGPDGLRLLRLLVAGAGAALRPGGALVLEVGQGQAEAVADLARQAGFGDVHARKDLAGISRVVVARWPAGNA
jgi:release factor glutamine methyltransferase